MARKVIERNISYDDIRGKYYVTLHHGVKKGKQIKTTETFTKKRDAKRRLIEFESERDKGEAVMPNSYTLSEWLDYWLENIVLTSCAKTTYTGYKYIVYNHIII